MSTSSRRPRRSGTRCRPQFRLATFTDRDVILVKERSLKRGRLRVGDVAAHNFDAELTVSVAGNPVAVPRGWSEVDIRVRGRTFTFVNTHLEAYGSSPLSDQVRNPQAVEFAAAIAESRRPVVLVGDINVRPTMCAEYRPSSPQYGGDQNIVAYQTLLKAGLTEVWPMVYPRDPCGPEGWTSGQDALDGPVSTLDHRIDDGSSAPVSPRCGRTWSATSRLIGRAAGCGPLTTPARGRRSG